MPEQYEVGQVVKVKTISADVVYLRLSENGHWYELSERMSGGMSTAEVWRLGDVEPLIPKPKVAEPERTSADRATAAAIEMAAVTAQPLAVVVATIRDFMFDERQRVVVAAARRLVNETELGPYPSAARRALLQAVNALDGGN